MKVKNVSGTDLSVPWLGRAVLAGQVVDVGEYDSYAFTQQATTWAPADDDAQARHDSEAKRLGAVDAAEAGTLEEPAGNASLADWSAYVVAADLATGEDIEGMGRDEIRDTYGSK